MDGSSKCVIYNGADHTEFCPDEVTGWELKDYFELDFVPDRLVDKESNQMIRLTKNRKPQAGRSYNIEKTKEQESKSGNPLQPDLADIAMNAVFACEAVYKDEDESCLAFLKEHEQHHRLGNIIRSKLGTSRFLIAEGADRKRVYIAFRGTHIVSDWENNLKASLTKSVRHVGSFHQGYLAKAEEFPLALVIMKEEYKDSTFVFCGHSAGGAVAAIVMTGVAQRLKQVDEERNLICITFGAPSFGDSSAAVLCRELEIDSQMYHYATLGDAIAFILSYGQILSAFVETMSSVSSNKLFKQATSILGQILTCLKTVFEIQGPNISQFHASVIARLIDIVNTITNSPARPELYCNIGNFIFISPENSVSNIAFTKNKDKDRQFTASQGMAKVDCDRTFHNIMVNHSIEKYRNTLLALPTNKTPIRSTEIKIIDMFQVHLKKAYLKVIGRSKEYKADSSQLVIEGINISAGFLPQCTECKSIELWHNKEALAWEVAIPSDRSTEAVKIIGQKHQDLTEGSDHGFRLKVATVFGLSNELHVTKDNISFIAVDSKPMTNNENVKSMLEKAFKRSILTHILEEQSETSKELKKEIIQLARLVSDDKTALKLDNLLMAQVMSGRKFQLSQETHKEFHDMFNDIISSVCKIPYYLETKHQLRIYIVALSLALTAAIVTFYPDKIAVAVGLSKVEVASLLASGGSVVLRFMITARYEAEYALVLKLLITLLLHEAMNDDLRNKVNGSVQEMEEAVLQLAEASRKDETGKNEDNAFMAGKISAVRCIFQIRRLLNKQAYIALTGHEKTGKTRLLNSLPNWGKKEKAHSIDHTDGMILYQVHNKVILIDFPGSNGLGDYSSLFSTMGQINNLVIMVMRYGGDLDKYVTDEIVSSFIPVVGSNCTKVIVCINRCLPNLIVDLANDEGNENAPLDRIRSKYAENIKTRLEEKFNSNNDDKIKLTTEFQKTLKDSILFTDWSVDCATKEETPYLREAIEAGKKIGVVGVQAVKMKMKEYLLEYGVFTKDQEKELDDCLEINTTT